jgi:5'-deoxynucleotidase YfbR-like HD superfamily hydrolase
MALVPVELRSHREPLVFLVRTHPSLRPHLDAEKTNPLRYGTGAEDVARRLHDIIRFGNGEKLMHSPTTVHIHSLRTESIALYFALLCKKVPDCPPLDLMKVSLIARIHDYEEADPDIGDMTRDKKMKMSLEERETHEAKVKSALVGMGTKEFGLADKPDQLIRYTSLVEELLAKSTYEAQIAKLADLFDARGEVMHELRNNNKGFIPILGEYNAAFTDARKKYPLWNALEGQPGIDMRIPTQAEALLEERPLMPLDFAYMPEGEGGVRQFRKRVLQGNFPPAYKTWLKLTFMRFGDQAPRVLYPNWHLPIGA